VLAFVARPGRVRADLRPINHQNVLLITIDTLRADALGCYGGPAATPALDRLAREGARFTFAHAQTVLTLPSHTSILSGEYPFQHGIRENSGYRLVPGTRTMSTLLKQAGYATGAFVGAFPLHSRFGLNLGFDVYEDRFGETRAPTEFIMPERPASAVVPLARDWIGRVGARPWFAWVHVFDPHAPYQPPPPFDKEYAGRPYYGEVAAVDHALAPLLDDVRTSPRPTFVVVTGDHGEALGDHGEATHGLFAYESTLRIPLIFAELGAERATDVGAPLGRGDASRFGPRRDGEVSPIPVRHIDVLPTVLDAIGEAIPSDLPGRTLLPARERQAGAQPRASYFEAMSAMLNRGWAPLTGVLVGREKYIDLPIAEMYDLVSDPGEQSNLAGQSSEHVRTLQARLREFGASLPGERRSENTETLTELRALGYVSGTAPGKAHYTEADDPKRLVDIDRDIHRGVELYGDKRFDEATQVYLQVIGRRPDMAIAYRHLAFVAWETGNVKGAIDVLERARQAGVRHGGITTQLATYLAESGDAPAAIRLLAPVATQDWPEPDALNALGIAYARTGRSQEARATFERMLAITPDSGMALENLGALDLERGDLASAQQRFEQAASVDPRSSQVYSGLGVVALKKNDRTTAIGALTQAVQLDPTNYDALYNLAMTLERDGQSARARPYLEQFVRSAPQAFYARDIREISALLRSRR